MKKYAVLFLGILATVSLNALANSIDDQFINIQREPDAVSVVTEKGVGNLAPTANGDWSAPGDAKVQDIKIHFQKHKGGLEVSLDAPQSAVKSLQISWHAASPADWKYLGDTWERAYGDLEWQPLNGQRVMPWYFLASSGTVTHGYGVQTGPGALCYWTVDASNIVLHADVRCGGQGVLLGSRELDVCNIVSREGRAGETSFAAARAFCRDMCPKPRLPKQPVYGFNDWYCTYGHDTAGNFLTNVAYLVSLEGHDRNRPYAVVDDGWQWKGDNEQLWDRTSPKFSATLAMDQFAGQVKALGARPGLWYRPLLANADQPKNWRLQRDSNILDPTVPEVRALIRENVARFHGWGFELIKHDYSTFDICGRWGKDMGSEITSSGWSFADRSKTTAEVIRDLYQDIREAAGNDTLIIGCNTMSHLAAGIFEMQRIGDDTSGRDWERTRDMGVNCLAFRAPQNGTFYAVDADCAGQVSSNSVDWSKNSQWLYLLGHSGAPLFVSFPYDTVSAEQKQALQAALKAAAHRQPLADPLDWQTQRTPTHWLLDNHETVFHW